MKHHSLEFQKGRLMEGLGARPHASSLRVLVVDDDADTLSSMSILLEMYGYQVFTAEDGFEALELVSAYQPHVVVLDVAMPGFSGLTLAKRIRDAVSFRRPFLIAHTGMSDRI